MTFISKKVWARTGHECNSYLRREEGSTRSEMASMKNSQTTCGKERKTRLQERTQQPGRRKTRSAGQRQEEGKGGGDQNASDTDVAIVSKKK